MSRSRRMSRRLALEAAAVAVAMSSLLFSQAAAQAQVSGPSGPTSDAWQSAVATGCSGPCGGGGGGATNTVAQLNPTVNPTGGACDVPYSSGTGLGGTPEVVHESVDLSQFDGEAVQLQFSFNTGDNLYNAFKGWFVRKIEVTGQTGGGGGTFADPVVFDDPVTQGDTNFSASAPAQDGGPLWQVTSSQDATLGGPAWWFGNSATGTYQNGPIDNCTDTSASSGTLTSGVIHLDSSSVLTFDTLWQIESVDPATYDLMQVNVLPVGSSNVIDLTSALSTQGFQPKVPLAQAGNTGADPSVSVANLSKWPDSTIDPWVKRADEGLHTWCGTNQDSDMGAKKNLDQPPQFEDQMNKGDIVVVTDDAMYWFDRVNRSGLLAGMWAIRQSGPGSPGPFYDNTCGLPENYLLPGSSGELSKSKTHSGWLGDGMAVIVLPTCAADATTQSETTFVVQHTTKPAWQNVVHNADPLTELGNGAWKLSFSGVMRQEDTTLSNYKTTATDCTGTDRAEVHYQLTYTFGDNVDSSQLPTLPRHCPNSPGQACALERNWLQVGLQLNTEPAPNGSTTDANLDVNTATISFSLGNIAPPHEATTGLAPVIPLDKYPAQATQDYLNNFSSMGRTQYEEGCPPDNSQAESRAADTWVALQSKDYCNPQVYQDTSSAGYLGAPDQNAITEYPKACAIDGQQAPDNGWPYSSAGGECANPPINAGAWTTQSRAQADPNTMSVTLLQPGGQISSSSSGGGGGVLAADLTSAADSASSPATPQFQRSMVNSALFNTPDNVVALDDGLTQACDYGGTNCLKPNGHLSSAVGLTMYYGHTYSYSVDVLAGSLAGLIKGTVTTKPAGSDPPVQGATVQVAQQTPEGPYYYPPETTDADGSFALADLPAGTYQVTVTGAPGANLQPQTDTVTLSAGDVLEDDFQLLPGATVQGSVSGGGQLLSGAEVQVCGQDDGTCSATTSDQSGQWSVDGLPAGTYDATAYPPSYGPSGLGVAQASTAVADGGDASLALTLPGPTPLPMGTSIGPAVGSYNGSPELYWDEPITLATTGCPGGSAQATFAGYAFGDFSGGTGEGPDTVSVPLNEGPPASGSYSGTVSALYPMHGQATVTISVTCPDPAQDQDFSFTVYIDPSGSVVDQSGDPVAGATVSLLSADNPSGPFSPVPAGSAVMSPDNRANPVTTGADGAFGWDVVAGWYEIQASAPGCISATDTSQPVATTPASQVPPPMTGVRLVLDCETGAPTTLRYTGPTTADSGSSVDLSAVLSSPALTATASTLTGTASTLGPVAGEQVTLSFAGQSCTATSDTTGTASCTVVPSGPPGPTTASASFAGDTYFQASSTAQVAAQLGPDQPTLSSSPPPELSYGTSTTLSAELDDESGNPVSGALVSFNLGSGANAQSCSAPTDGTGTASCSIYVQQPAGPQPVQVSYAGGPGFGASSVTASTTVMGEGYWLASADGTVYPEGGAVSYGSLSASTPAAPPEGPATTAPGPAGPVVGIAPTPDGAGYWLATANGDVYSFGDATDFCTASTCSSLGSPPPANAGKVVGIAASPDGFGYWLSTSDGTVYALGGAEAFGSLALGAGSAPITGIAATPSGYGYWLVGADGTVYSFGDASGYCSQWACTSPPGPSGDIVGITANPTGLGYWLVGADGTVHALGGAPDQGSPQPPPPAGTVGIAASPDGGGYWDASADGTADALGDAQGFCAGLACSGPGAGAIVAVAADGITPAANDGYTTYGQASPEVDWSGPADITYGTPLGTAQLDATASVPGTFTYTPAAGTVLPAGADQVLTVQFTPDDSADYASTTATTTITVDPAAPTVNWASPPDIAYGTPLGAGQLDATASVPGTFAYNPPAGTVLGVGTQPLSAIFTPDDTADYLTATASTTITVDRAVPTIAWPGPASLTFGTPLSAAQLDATAPVPGTFSYSPPAGAVLEPGPETLTVTFTPADTAHYSTATASETVTVGFTKPCITSTLNGSIVVAKGQSVCIEGARVTGSISVSPGGALWASGASIGGSLSSSGASALALISTTVTGSVSVTGSQGPVTISGPSNVKGSLSMTSNKAPVTFAHSNVTGSVSISSNFGGFVATADTIGGSMSVTSNTGGTTFTSNTVGGSLAIIDNGAPFQYAGNTVRGWVTNLGNG